MHFVMGIPQSAKDSPHKGQVTEALSMSWCPYVPICFQTKRSKFNACKYVWVSISRFLVLKLYSVFNFSIGRGGEVLLIDATPFWCFRVLPKFYVLFFLVNVFLLKYFFHKYFVLSYFIGVATTLSYYHIMAFKSESRWTCLHIIVPENSIPKHCTFLYSFLPPHNLYTTF